jgi:hypothetical protein
LTLRAMRLGMGVVGRHGLVGSLPSAYEDSYYG